MKQTYMSVLAASLSLAIAAGVGYAAPLTEQQLLKMKAAGVGEAVIIQQIQTDGIAFQADVDSTIALRKAGFSDAVLSAVLKAPPGQVAASPQSRSGEAQPPSQAQVDACVTWQQEWERLNKEDDAIRNSCDAVTKQYHDESFTDHCIAINACPVEKRLVNIPNPRHCAKDDVVPVYPCDDPESRDYTLDQSFVHRFKAAQVLQPHDNQLSCAQLKVLTSVFADNVALMDKSLGNLHGEAQALNNQAQTNSSLAEMASVIGGKGAPIDAAALSMLSSSDSQAAGNAQQQAGSLQQIRDSQQKRHDYLMQLYFQRHCDD